MSGLSNDTYANNYDVTHAVYLISCTTVCLVARQEGPFGYKAMSGLFNDTYTNNYDVMLAVHMT